MTVRVRFLDRMVQEADLAYAPAMTHPGPRPDPAAYALEVVGERWTLLVVRELMHGTHRFDALQAATGAPRDQLSARLKTLVAAGLARRVPYSERPLRHEYHLTDGGLALRPILLLLRAWGTEHVLAGAASPVVSTHTCGAVFTPVLACSYCGEPESGDGLEHRWAEPVWRPAATSHAGP